MPRFATQVLEFDKVKKMLADKAATVLGKKAADNLFISGNYQEVVALQEETAEIIRIFDAGKRLPFGGIFNIIPSLKKAEIGSVLEAEELLHIGSTLVAIENMKTFLHDFELIPHLLVYGDNLQIFSLLEKQINATVDEHGEIKDSASPQLKNLRSSIKIAKNRIKEHLDGILHDQSKQKYFQDALVTMRGDRYVIPIKQEYRLNFPGIVHDQSSTGATLFIEPLEIVDLNNNVKRYLTEERDEIERILRQITLHIGKEAKNIADSLQIITKLDVISARGYLAEEQRAVRPELCTGNKIRIVEGRHPLIDKQKVVPITVELGGENLMLLVTGPNTGGKTVALKTVGLFALMAQTGMYIPALTAELPVFNAIYADIGDEQSIEQSLSTFSSHMTNIIKVLQTVREGDLVLIDEICAGTDPNEGAALAMSILEEFFERKVLTMVTTHYSELKTFAYGHNGMQNASVEFDVESLRPTYRLLMGVPGNSNAFNISRRLGLDDIIVNRAGKMLNEEHTHMEKVLQDLDIKRRGYEEGKSEVEKIKFEAEMLRNQLAYQKKEFLKYRDDMLRRAREKADDIYRESRREAEGIIKELRSHKNVVDTKVLQEIAERARQTLNKQLSGDNPVPEGTKLTNATAKVGQKVFVTTLGKNGYVISLNSSDITVRVGILKMNVLPEQCILVVNQPVSVVLKKEKSHNLSSSHKLFVEKSSGSKQDVDLRGLMVEEAIVVVDKAIDDALLAGVGRLRIIHGKGTGALKAGIVPYLIKHNMVVGVQEAAPEEGGAGVTVINLK